MKTTDKSPRQLWCRNRSVFCCLSDLTSTPKRGCHNESTRQTLHQRSSIAQRTPTIRHGEKMPFVRAAAKQGVLWCVNFGGKLCNSAKCYGNVLGISFCRQHLLHYFLERFVLPCSVRRKYNFVDLVPNGWVCQPSPYKADQHGNCKGNWNVSVIRHAQATQANCAVSDIHSSHSQRSGNNNRQRPALTHFPHKRLEQLVRWAPKGGCPPWRVG
jgi:hypothetical protein